MSLFAELKRRNVFRVAAAYVIVGWLVMQIGEVMSPALHLPEWSNSFLAWLLILGFPVAILFAWAFELTSEGLRRESDVDRGESVRHETGRKLNIAIVIGVLLAAGWFGWDRLKSGPENPASTAGDQGVVIADPPGAGTATDPRSIAVLPFQNRSADAENAAFFSDGVHDELLTRLSRIDDLKVISRTSVMAYRDTQKNLRDIGAELGVATVLEGGVQRAKDQVRINVQLIDAASDEHLWAQTYDRELTAENVFAIQSEIATAIADALHAALSPEEQADLAQAPTRNLAAYDHYLLARQLSQRFNWDALEQALDELDAALALDPGFAAAWAQKGFLYRQLVDTGARSQSSVIGPWREAVAHALELAPDSATSQIALGTLLVEEDPARAHAAFTRAWQLEPRNSQVLVAYAFDLRDQGEYEDALEQLEKAREVDPLSTSVLWSLGRLNMILGRHEVASQAFERVRAIDPASANGKAPASGPYIVSGDFPMALHWIFQGLDADPDDMDLLGWVVRFQTDLGDEAAAGDWLNVMVAKDPDYPLTLALRAMFLAREGDIDAAATLASRHLEDGMPDRWGSQSIATRVLLLQAVTLGDPGPALTLLGSRFPALFSESPAVDNWTVAQAVDVANLLQRAGQPDRAHRLLEAVLAYTARPYALGGDVNEWRRTVAAQALALLGRADEALAELRTRVDAGWRLMWHWDLVLNPNFDAVREQAEFARLVDTIRDDMAQQRVRAKAMESTGEIPAPPGVSG